VLLVAISCLTTHGFPLRRAGEASANREAYLQQSSQAARRRWRTIDLPLLIYYPVAMEPGRDTLPSPGLEQFPEWARLCM
jgi:hypothetical protein